MNKKNEKLNFEDSLKRLEKIAELLESEETSLEESIMLFEEGIALKEVCEAKLKNAKLKIEKIIKSNKSLSIEKFE
ncbi:MAG: exodeoxyribonuclease VII small subunit [Pelagibacteraceae bacterium]|nr:exodeoxyribonuclease VII small subunit [Pelagibacteraceae bacterium]|tara:strand:- start:2587 stop:2814 length:228 start_codon:yes stop_codon:yes gene_type:complete